MSVRDLIILGCSSQQPTRLRNHGAYLLRWNDEGFLFDPGEGTQRQFIFAEVSPPTVTRIFVSHFHGDHCLGLGSMLMRLNLDKVTHPIHCYYPASGQVYFDRLRYGSIYHEHINVVPHPVFSPGEVHVDENFSIEAFFLDHGVENIGWRITESPVRKFDKHKLDFFGVRGPLVRLLEEKSSLDIGGRSVSIDEVSQLVPGDVFAVAIDTRPCQAVLDVASRAQMFLCESTYLERHKHLAEKHHHLTAREAATMALNAHAESLILTHFSARYQDLSEFEIEARSIFPNTFAADDLKRFPFPKKSS